MSLDIVQRKALKALCDDARKLADDAGDILVRNNGDEARAVRVIAAAVRSLCTAVQKLAEASS